MDIKNKAILIIYLFFSIIFFNSFQFFLIDRIQNHSNPSQSLLPDIKISQFENETWPKTYIDKVYTFPCPQWNESFKLSFRKYYFYRLYFSLVVPANNVTISVKIIDPDGIVYEMYDDEMFMYPENGRDFYTVFGAAKTGNYSLEVFVETEFNTNIHIKISETLKIFSNEISSFSKVINDSYDVYPFRHTEYSTETIEYLFELKEDTWHTVMAQRVTDISRIYADPILDIIIQDITIIIYDPLMRPFLIFSEVQIPGRGNVPLKILFGTAMDGQYKMKITTNSTGYPQYNLAFLLYNSGSIGEGINETEVVDINYPQNETTPSDNQTSALDNRTFYFVIPEESIVITTLGIVSVISIVLIARTASMKRIKTPEIKPNRSKKEIKKLRQRQSRNETQRERQKTRYEY